MSCLCGLRKSHQTLSILALTRSKEDCFLFHITVVFFPISRIKEHKHGALILACVSSGIFRCTSVGESVVVFVT